MNKIPLKVKYLNHYKADLLRYQTEGASGFDARASIETKLILKPFERRLIPTGISLEIPAGFEIQVRPRSGLALKKGLSIPNAPGTIDCDYRGEIKVIVINMSDENIEIEPQDRIAQLVLVPVVQANFITVQDLSFSERNADGFGSTGV